MRNYTVYRHDGSGLPLLLARLGNVQSYIDSGLGNNATLHYAVAAVNLVGEGPHSEEANATTFDTPNAPLNVTASTGPGGGEVTLNRRFPANDGGTPITGYTVYAGSSAGNLSQLAVLGDVLTYTESGLPNNATRHYAVSATNIAGEGPQSNQVAAGTFDEPTAPLNLAAAAGIGNVTLAWLPAARDGGTPVVGYNIYRGDALGSATFYAELGSVLTYVDANATPGTRYTYTVMAVNLAGESDASNEASARPSSLLLSLPSVPLPPIGVPPASVGIVVCDAGSEAGCTVPGDSHLCIELQTAAGPATKLACLDQALVPPEVNDALHGLSPIEVGYPGAPAGSIGPTPEIEVTYLHEAALLNQVLAACPPLRPTPEDANWFLANGGETSMTVTLKGNLPTEESVVIPLLGQIVAASQATVGEIPCG